MKRAIVCYNCGKMKRESESYSVKVSDFQKGEFLFDKNDVAKIHGSKVVKICRACSKHAGYKVKKTSRVAISKP